MGLVADVVHVKTESDDTIRTADQIWTVHVVADGKNELQTGALGGICKTQLQGDILSLLAQKREQTMDNLGPGAYILWN